MNKNHNTNQTLIQFILRAQQLARRDAKSERGYAMLMTSMISIAMLSMLAAYMTMTNLSKSSTNAYVDGTNTFYAAESGLNKRAQEFRQKFANYSTPSGTVPNSGSTAVTAANIVNCFSISVNATTSATDDFECRNYPFKYNNNIAAVNSANGDTVVSEGDNNSSTSKYVAHTFVAPAQNYARTVPSVITIPSGEPYTGLKAIEYKYTVYATATKRDNVNDVVPNFTPAQIAAKARVVKITGDTALIASYDTEQARVDALNATNNNRSATTSTTNSVLQMDFRSRVVPLFQFAAFYDGDLEMNSSSNMTLGGRVHTNANFYVRPVASDANVSTTFLSAITAKGDIYNRVDASNSVAYTSAARVLMLGTSCAIVTNCRDLPAFGASTTDLTRGATDKLSALELNPFGSKVKDGASGIARLETPPPGFLRKRNYYDSWTGNTATATNNSGEYYSRADMRLEMLPDRDADITTAAPWTRNRGIIPFNFTSITRVAGAADTCTTTLPAKDAATNGVPTLANDPAANYIDPERNNPGTTGTLLTNLHCNVFSKGQLQSLRQPVMVLTDSHQTTAGLITATGATPTATSEAGILGRPALPAIPTITATDPTKDAILRALQVAIVSTPAPIELQTLGNTAVSASAFGATFSTLINSTNIPALSDADRITLNAATPNAIAALRNAWFLPAPIQRIEHNQPDVSIAANIRGSGFYDGRERRWMAMLQTNIASLSVWNRDGIYVEASAVPTGTTANIDTDVRTAYATNPAMQKAAFDAVFSPTVPGANFGNGLAFDRASTVPSSPKGLQALGLGSVDTTEGGLVFHATVSDDLNGDGVITAANDISLDINNPIMKRDAIGTLVGADNQPVTATNPAVTIDYPRKYRNAATIPAGTAAVPAPLPASPFGFAFNGGDYLPGPLTLVTDQPIYVQGNFNNNGADQTPDATTGVNIPSTTRLPASIVGDVITILSNQCLNQDTANGSTPTATNHLGTPVGQIKCGLPKSLTGSVNIGIGLTSGQSYYTVTAPTAVNAAFLSNTDRSNGNLGNGRFVGTTRRFSGGLNNYMRMLERWNTTSVQANGQFFNYSGSFVSLGIPIESSGAYNGGNNTASFLTNNYYNIPQRNFNFDSKFEVFSGLPPLPPRAVYLQQEIFKRSYN
jgi:Tfp pilus assembly protein PilX